MYDVLLDCSGLTTISRYPIEYRNFEAFDDQGGLCDMDLHYFGKKGMGHIRIAALPNVTVEFNCSLKFTSYPNLIL